MVAKGGRENKTQISGRRMTSQKKNLGRREKRLMPRIVRELYTPGAKTESGPSNKKS